MNELDRRIAVEVMGEPEPQRLEPGSEEVFRLSIHSFTHFSEGGNWYLDWCQGVDRPDWHPLPFSSDIDQAERAANHYLSEQIEMRGYATLDITYYPEIGNAKSFYEVAAWRKVCSSKTLPEAICNLLLALVDDDKRLVGT